MKPSIFVLPVALLGLLTACGGSSSAASKPTSVTSPTTAASSTVPASTASAPTGGTAAGGTVLTGEVGKGDAFVISLKDSTGADVKTLKAGSYQIKVSDLSKIHDFHLTGPGVEKTTSVPEVQDVTWSVTLTAGTYKFVCDPHAQQMAGSFTVS